LRDKGRGRTRPESVKKTPGGSGTWQEFNHPARTKGGKGTGKGRDTVGGRGSESAGGKRLPCSEEKVSGRQRTKKDRSRRAERERNWEPHCVTKETTVDNRKKEKSLRNNSAPRKKADHKGTVIMLWGVARKKTQRREGNASAHLVSLGTRDTK